MTSRFMMSVAAAALIAGAGFAYAQGTGGEKGSPGSAGSAIQQNAPSTSSGGSSAAPSARDATEPGGMKSTQSDQKSPGAAKSKSAQDDMKAGAKGDKQDKSAQDNNMKGDRSKSMSSENEKGAASKDKNMKAEGRDGMKAEGRDGMKAEGRDGMKAEGRDVNKNAESKGGATERSQTTTGQAGGGVRLSGEQRTRITGVIRDQRVEPLANANFSISVGARVPRDITFYPLPAEVVTIYPEWRGYEFVRVRDQILVINPRTLEIVAVLEA
jgi:Protein of unknown function (DUF1236)